MVELPPLSFSNGDCEPAFFSARELRARGWTRGLIRTFLGPPDATAERASPLRPQFLYQANRVLLSECEPAFVQALNRAERAATRARARNAASTARAVAIARAQAVDLSCIQPQARYVETVQAACRNHQASFIDDSGLPFGWERVAVEFYLQHAQPLFATLDDFFGVPGVREARTVLRNRILDRIAECYSALLVAVAAAKAQDAAKHPVHG